MTANKTLPSKGWVGYLIKDEIWHGGFDYVYATKIEVQSFGKKRGTCTLVECGEFLKSEIWPSQSFALNESEIKSWIKTEMAELIAACKRNIEFRISKNSIWKGEEKLAKINEWNPENVEIRYK